MIAAVYAATWLRFHYFHNGEVLSEETIASLVGPLGLKAVLFAAVLFLSMLAMGLYSTRNMLLGVIGVHLRVLASHLLGFVAFVVISYLFPTLFLGRGLMMLSVLLALVFVIASRHLFVSLLKSNQLNRRVLVYGSGHNASSIDAIGEHLKKLGVSVVGYLASPGGEGNTGHPTITRLNQSLTEYAHQQQVDLIVVAMDDRRGALPTDELIECRLEGIEVVDLPTFFESTAAKIRIDLMPPSWLIFGGGFETGAATDLIKRGVDLTAALALLLLSWPFMVFTMMAIKFEDGWKAPVIYRQVRVGKDGKLFQIYKFRSMRCDAEQGQKPQWATSNDPRITRVGQIIRLLRIDELPQLLNVIKGDMSFVGPRPERPEFVETLSKKIPYYNERHRVKPGVTGWAQLNYPYGASDRDSMEKLQFDLYYTKNHSMMLDLIILLQTLEVVLFGKGAR